MRKICVHCFISGHVQGVFFRRETYNRAQALQLTGWVKNLPDGRVEAVICGAEAAIIQMKEWLWQGSPAATVTAVAVQEIPWQEYNQFEVR
jgi:acylphosphatase